MKNLLVLFLSFCTIGLWAQEGLQEGYSTSGGEAVIITRKGDRFIAAGAGAGLSYGNLGVKLQWKATRTFGLSAGFGSRSVPLSLPYVFTDFGEDDKLLHELDVPFTNKTLTSLSFNAGFDIWAGNNVSIGFHYANFGKWTSLYDQSQKTLHGFIMPVEGHISLGRLPLAITVGGTFGGAFGSDKYLEQVLPPSETGGDTCFFGAFIFGIDVGIVYKFKY